MPATFADGQLSQALRSLDRAASAKTPNGIFVHAFTAATHAAAAIVSSRIPPEQASKRDRPSSLWAALIMADPEHAGWAKYFLALQRQKNLADTNARNAVTRDQAEELLRDVTDFLTTAEGIVRGVPEQVS